MKNEDIIDTDLGNIEPPVSTPSGYSSVGDDRIGSERPKIRNKNGKKKGVMLLPIEEDPNEIIENRNVPLHTEINNRGRIICQTGYIGDDPVANRGCWKCKSECHVNALCDYPGKCVCKPGYTGDGITSCKSPVPFIISYHATSFPFAKDDILSIRFGGVNKKYPITRTFCKIGPVILEAESFANRTIRCKIPLPISARNISISLDGLEWSESREIEKQKEFNLIPIYVSAFCSIILMAYVVRLFIAERTSSFPPLRSKVEIL